MLVTTTDAAVDPLWSGLNLDLFRGEFLTVLGPNGVGKSTLLAALMGNRSLTAGSLHVNGRIGYIPQQRMFPAHLPLRSRDLVSLALAHGVLRGRTPARGDVDTALDAVGAGHLTNRRVGELSGGQQQLVRQAQAFAGDPDLLLCDEPLLSLDLAAQHATVDRLAARLDGAAVVFVTHSINPVLEVTDRVLYLAPRGHLLGSVADVMRSDVLSDLYGTRVTVAEVDGKMVVL